MTREILLFIGGVGGLVFGAEWLVRGRSRLSASRGVEPGGVGRASRNSFYAKDSAGDGMLTADTMPIATPELV